VGSRRSVRLKVTLAFSILLLVVVLSHRFWLTALGSALVYDQGPSKADVAVVLAGDPWGYRLIRATELVKQGYVPRILVSGPAGFYGLHESEVAIRFAVQQGFPEEWFVPVPNQTTSTRTEAVDMLNEMRRRRIHSFLLVTSNYHTARARRIYLKAERKMGGGPDLRVVASPDHDFAPDDWWRSRQGLKMAFMEWSKTVADALGI
jgi:uncharacterized SAM-binding protein YcdF (DUF218 family)